MHWQDIAISIAQWVSVIALLPSIMGKDKPALSSSLLTAACIALFLISYLSLGLIVSGVSASLLLLVWLILAYQQWHIIRQRKAGTM